MVPLLGCASLLMTTLLLISTPGAASASSACTLTLFNSKSSDPVGTKSGIYGVDALSSTDAWAVGRTILPTNPVSEAPVAYHWKGAHWKQVPVALPPSGDGADLVAVSMVSASDVWAVGEWASPTTSLLEHWNGRSWKIVPGPVVQGASGVTLRGLSADATNDVWAVGYAWFGTGGTSLVEHFDGSSWTATLLPHAVSSNEVLQSVDAIAPDDVWAVGISGESGIALHYDGSSWSVSHVFPPSIVNGNYHSGILSGVSASSAADVWAVGEFLVEHWDGQSWTEVAGPPASFPEEVAVGSSSSLWTASRSSTDLHQPSVAHFDGTWTQATLIDSVYRPSVGAVAAIPGTNSAWAVGQRGGNTTKPLFLMDSCA